jgi:hypothetical protein
MISPEDDFITPRPMGIGLNENEANCYFYMMTLLSSAAEFTTLRIINELPQAQYKL